MMGTRGGGGVGAIEAQRGGGAVAHGHGGLYSVDTVCPN